MVTEPTYEDPRHAFGMLLGSAYRALLRCLGRRFASAGYDITPEQFTLMLHLWRQEGPSQQTLAELADRDKPTITRMIDVMEKRGLVTRVGHQADGRVKQVFLTEAGHAAKAGLDPHSREALDEALRGIDPADLACFLSVLERVRANLDPTNREEFLDANTTPSGP